MAVVQFPNEIGSGTESGILTRVKYIFDDNGTPLAVLLARAGSGRVSWNSATNVLTVNDVPIDLSPVFAIGNASVIKFKGVITLEAGESISDALSDVDATSSVGDVYIIESSNASQNEGDIYDEYIKVQTGIDNGTPVYTWERLGTISAARSLTPTASQIGGGNTNYKIVFG